MAARETHDPRRQQTMLEKAEKTANTLRNQPGVLGVVLSGSAARGPVNKASDLDLHMIVSSDFSRILPEWTFHKDDTIENLHTIKESLLLSGWRVCNNVASLAAWFYETKLGDELHGFIPLWWHSATRWQRDLSVLISHRQDQDVAQIVAQRYVAAAQAHIRQGRNACDGNASYDCHQHLRVAFQAALIAALVARGWITRGSKKRIEIAQAFLPDPLIESLLDAGFDVIGLNGMTSNQAGRVCKARLHYRTVLLSELHRLKLLYTDDKHTANKLAVIIDNQKAHNAMAYDYYSPLIGQNIILGPINHIRCLSGLPHIPQLLVSCLRGEQLWPIREFVQSDIISRTARDAWLEIMALTSSRQRCNRLSSAISTAVDNLKSHIA